MKLTAAAAISEEDKKEEEKKFTIRKEASLINFGMVGKITLPFLALGTRKRKRKLGDQIKEATAGKKFLMGNAHLTK